MQKKYISDPPTIFFSDCYRKQTISFFKPNQNDTSKLITTNYFYRAGVTGNFPPLKIFPPRGGRFPRKFSPHPENLPPRGVNFPRKFPPREVNFPMKAVLRVKTANLPPDRGYWHFLRKKIIGGYKFLGKLPPGGYKFLGKPPPPGGEFS